MTTPPAQNGTSIAGPRFPRAIDLPTQSPQFWVQQKDRYLRQLLIRDIEEISQRRLVVFFGNRYAKGAEISAQDMACFVELFHDCFGAPVDLLLETIGGSTDTTEALVAFLKQSVPDVRVIVANAAKSSGTMLALSSSCIVMGPPSELGPIEPSVGPFPVSTLIQDYVRDKDFALHMDGVQALRQAVKLSGRLLTDGMMKGAPQEQIDRAINALTTRNDYPSHGSVVDRSEARAPGLNILNIDPGDSLWDRIWLLYCMYDHDMRLSGNAKIFEGHSLSTTISALPP